MKSSWSFLVFPATVVLVVSPLVVLGQRFLFPQVDISGFGGPSGIPFVLLVWSTPIYILALGISHGVRRRYRRMMFAILALLGWLLLAALGAMLIVACIGGGCRQSQFAEVTQEAAIMLYLVFLCWLAHGPVEGSRAQSAGTAP